MVRDQFELEICANSVASVLAADKGGADRVELCDNLYEGGTTPSLGTIIHAKERSEISVYVIIRPRGGDFIYTDDEFEVMLKDVDLAQKHGADGIVIGCLNPDGTIDAEKCSKLMEQARGLPVTFHRAFDMVRDPMESLETLKKLGVRRLLTSGLRNKALEGTELLSELRKHAGDRLKIIAGSGINEDNILEIFQRTKVRCFHASLTEVIDSQMQYRQEGVFMGGLPEIPEYTLKVTSVDRVRQVIHLLNTA